MKDFDLKALVRDRNEAFRDVLYNDDLCKLEAYCRKYHINVPEDEKIIKMSIYEAIQHCIDFSEEDKTDALCKFYEIGLDPFVGSVDGEVEE